MLYLISVYGARYGASALAANGLLRYLVGGSFPLFTIPSQWTYLIARRRLLLIGRSVHKPHIPLGVDPPGLPCCRVCFDTLGFLQVRLESAPVQHIR